MKEANNLKTLSAIPSLFTEVVSCLSQQNSDHIYNIFLSTEKLFYSKKKSHQVDYIEVTPSHIFIIYTMEIP